MQKEIKSKLKDNFIKFTKDSNSKIKLNKVYYKI